MYVKANIITPDGELEMTVYNGYYLNPVKPFIFEITEVEDNEIVTRECYGYHDEAMSEFGRVIGIEIANAIQDHRKTL